MPIISEFVKEQKRYTKSDLKKVFKLTIDETDKFIKYLKAYGILKTVKNNTEQRELSDLLDEDIEIIDLENDIDNYLYVFTYVGIITVGSRIIKCYPKYILAETNVLEDMKQIIKVIRKYGSKEQIINMMNGNLEETSYNVLAVIIYLLNDYHDYGIYNNTEDVIEINGQGDILWDKTVSESFSFIINNRPYYMELFTGRTIDDESDFFKKLHQIILTECSKQLKNTGLLDLFDIVSVELTEELLDNLGDNDYILNCLHNELNIQFNTRKQILLKTIYTYIAQNKTLEDNYGFSMFGTNNFNLIWEDVCAEVFNNKLNKTLGSLELPIPLKFNYNKRDKLIDIIKKPSWYGYNEDGSLFDKKANETLTPDLITINKDENNEYQFIIMDAKYYKIQLEETRILSGQPGVSDINKQYLYQLAFKEFIEDHGIKVIKNCFLLPSNKSEFSNIGIARMDILSSLGLEDIQIILLPVKIIYDHYLNRSISEITFLD